MISNRVFPAIAGCLVIAGCGGGSGSPSTTATVASATLNADVSGLLKTFIEDVEGPGKPATINIEDDGTDVKITITGTNADATFDSTVDTLVALPSSLFEVETADGVAFGRFIDGYEFQGFGYWAVTLDDTEPDFVVAIAAGSTGENTAVANMPARQSTLAEFEGESLGFARFPNEFTSNTSSTIRMLTDFDQLEFASFNTFRIFNGGGIGDPLPELDFSGFGSLSGNGFTIDAAGRPGPIQPIAGTVDGNFFGPAAEEVGGTFVMENPAGITYIGSFGARDRSLP